MKKIDAQTRERILAAADIVEVVSDFVTLKRRGANMIGLCPFHSERTPSFSVSKSRGICKCFSCGKGGSPVNFLMELEQMSYQEALRWLAKKYNIPIVEREETAEERRQASEREALFAVNEFARRHFVDILNNTDEGRNIGLTYFTERGLTAQTIERFSLGFASENSTSLYNDAINHGYTEENLIKTGLCSRSDRGVYDRFRGRVIFPVHSISGKVVAFGGRTLRSDKSVAKYVNSPESVIYSKSRELYGLYQARRAIVKQDKCILVEGYMDVLSMSQGGVENVVASSGTSLTTQQVNLIHRFTDNVTVIYDADPAGIKASLRGIDMLLAEGMNVKIVLFPEGEDPDSYARSHTSAQLTEYLSAHETDFITFKTDILLADATDPITRSRAVADIVRSVAHIPNEITRQIYIEQIAKTFNISPKTIALEVSKGVAQISEAAFRQRTAAASTAETENPADIASEISSSAESPSSVTNITGSSGGNIANTIPIVGVNQQANPLEPYEREVVRYLVRYAKHPIATLTENIDANITTRPLNVDEFIELQMQQEGIKFSCPLHTKLLQYYRESDSDDTDMLTGHLLSHPDAEIRKLTADLVNDRHRLSKVHERTGHIRTEQERIADLLPRAIVELCDAILATEINQINDDIRQASAIGDETAVASLMSTLMTKIEIRKEYARYLGDRIVLN